AGDPDCPSEAQEVDGGRTVDGVALLAALEEGERIPDIPQRLREHGLARAGGQVIGASGDPRRRAVDVRRAPYGRLGLHHTLSVLAGPPICVHFLWRDPTHPEDHGTGHM